jgi:ubiquinone/menaquinone biosynthesis C-methylase UbiE
MSTEQEKKVSLAFSKQASHFDAEDFANPILNWMREEIRNSVLKNTLSGNMLELNCGTGLDAIFFAGNGFNILATDNADGMLAELDKKITEKSPSQKIKTRKCSFNNLSELHPQKFDCIFSNFGGLNCSEDLSSVIQSMDSLVKPNGVITLVIMPAICPWEIALALKGNFKTAFRRFNKKGADSHLEGVNFKTWYYSPAYIKKAFGNNYQLLELKALGTIVPPPYMEKFMEKNPRLFKILKLLEKRINTKWPFYNCADHFLISVKKIN